MLGSPYLWKLDMHRGSAKDQGMIVGWLWDLGCPQFGSTLMDCIIAGWLRSAEESTLNRHSLD